MGNTPKEITEKEPEFKPRPLRTIKELTREELIDIHEILFDIREPDKITGPEYFEEMLKRIQTDLTDNYGRPMLISSWRCVFAVTGYLLSKGINLYHY